MKVGSIVKVKAHRVEQNESLGGFYRIRSIRGEYVNLASIFGNTIYHKRIPLLWLQEAEAEWYAQWSRSESYMSM